VWSRQATVSERPLRGATVTAAAIAVPDTVVGNDEIGELLGVDDAWIRSRTGVRERRRAGAGDSLVDYACAAATRSLCIAEIAPRDVDLLLVATMTADDIVPNAAPLVADRIDADGCAALDVGGACTGWLGALSLASATVEAGRAETVLVVGADLLSRVTDYADRMTAPLFGDGAGAVVVRAHTGPSRIGPIVLRTDAAGADWLYARRDEGVIRMAGPDTFRAAVAHLTDASRAAATAAGRALDEIDLFVFHQANARIIEAVAGRLELDPRRVPTCVERFGNTSAATLPSVLADAAEGDRLHDGDQVLLAAFGAGFTIGAGVVEWGAHA